MADAAAPDTKAGVKEEGDFINLRVVAQDNQELHFKIKRSTPMRKLISTYCKKKGLQADSVRFLFDGEQINPEATPETMDMEDKDVIDVMYQQTGGYAAW
eukprot:CAMPEP_0182920946 /NCGR_PEP_ID=MMETSP0105_2-20130417/3827_1 /TAXON_ID=81532 ORGANISM="Acanthoeca-like sp., Strain 10tr" /NCGR_SAMPLE_ID=MMETSP0105_2 /ASSEMBLY_ACC=CAM_ASM_000205 /LENGTH=99 /DNA_ID=CAMNT_0025058421 /DNA_START=63 /DNA_END=362 /DNA_ORIENTATION=-